MSIFQVNRQQYSQKSPWISVNNSPSDGFFQGGTGLPFYLDQLRQSRYFFNRTRNGMGNWMVPSNKFPTWQVVTEIQNFNVFLVKASLDNDFPDQLSNTLLDNAQFDRFCFKNTADNVEYQTLICDDRDRDNILDCGGFYFFQLGLEDYPDLFSEIFTVWDYSVLDVKLTGILFLISGSTAQVELTFDFVFNDIVDITGGTIGGQPIQSDPQTIFLNNVPLDTPQEIDVVVTTSNLGTFKQTYGYIVDTIFNPPVLNIYKVAK